MPVRIRTLRQFIGVMLLGAGLATVSSAVEIEEYLAGAWVMDDGSPALMFPANAEKFNVLRVSPGKSTWADGYFFLKWSNTSRPERGYYSTATGRLWITTYRFVNQKEHRVEYRGVMGLNEKGNVVWQGTATTTGARKVTWQFEATKR